MKKITRKAVSVQLALMLTLCTASTALGTEAAIGSPTESGHTVASYQYAYNEAGVVHLYDETGTTIVATIGSGAQLTVTDSRQNGRTYVQFGSSEGWINDSDLYLQLPQTATGEASGSSAPTQQLTPIQTNAPQQSSPANSGGILGDNETDENAPDEAGDDTIFPDFGIPAAPETDEDDSEPIEEGDNEIDATEESPIMDEPGDAEKDHEPIAAMYEPNGPDSMPVAVDVVQLGVVHSIILSDEGRQKVETALLTFGEEIPDGQQLGYVHAPRTGQAGLRETPSKTGKVITQLKAGQLAAVLAIEEEYAHVNVLGQEGWLRLDCLKYLTQDENGVISSNGQQEAAQEAEQPDASGNEAADESDVLISAEGNVLEEAPTYPAQAVLSCEGETDGSTSVNLRNLPTKDSAKTAVWRTGVSVTALSYQDGWYLVEADGICGYVMEAFVTIEE